MGLLIFAPYILVPWLTAFAFKKLKISTKHTWLTYIITLLLIFAYPFIFMKIDTYLNPPPPRYVDYGMVYVAFFFMNLILMIVSALLQMFFNNQFGIKYKGKENNSATDNS